MGNVIPACLAGTVALCRTQSPSDSPIHSCEVCHLLWSCPACLQDHVPVLCAFSAGSEIMLGSSLMFSYVSSAKMVPLFPLIKSYLSFFFEILQNDVGKSSNFFCWVFLLQRDTSQASCLQKYSESIQKMALMSMFKNSQHSVDIIQHRCLSLTWTDRGGAMEDKKATLSEYKTSMLTEGLSWLCPFLLMSPFTFPNMLYSVPVG